MLDDAVTLRLALDKTAVHLLLTGAGVHVPAYRELDRADLAGARAFLREHGSVVVKPASGTGGGEATTAGVRSDAELRRAFRLAGAVGRRVLLEREAPGDVYRLLLLEGRLLDVVRRSPPTLVGDGSATIRELVAAENRRRLGGGGEDGLDLLRVDLDTVLTLRRAGRRLGDVPGAGEPVALKTVTNENRIEDNETVRGPLADELVAEAARAAELVGVRLAGVDVITTDVTVPLAASGGVVIEVNGTPGLHHHYHVADRAGATRVAVPILERLLS
jgi:cyanophycin synthetase